MEEERMMRNTGLTLAEEGEGCRVYRMENESGTGEMKIFDLFPGVLLAYNDYHMRVCDSAFESHADLFCIDHCREGRLEYPAGEGTCSYVAAGDLKLDRRIAHTGHFSFPLRHYHGITISLELPQAAHALPAVFRDFPVDVYCLQQKFCADKRPYVLRGAPAIDHIIAELYAVPAQIRLPYFRLKVLELLLYLDALELPKTPLGRPYFYRGQVEKVKAAEALLTAEVQRHFTLEELSVRFEIPLTALKSCFRSVYGSPIGTYMRAYRMNLAAGLLRRETTRSVADIAGVVGYDSPSKFAAAFKDVLGVTPLVYRNRK